MPGIDAATIVSSAPPRYGIMRGAPEAEGGERVEEVTLLSHAPVHADYFATAGIPILEGRGFTEPEVVANAPVVVISDRTARRLWPQGGAVGGRLGFNEQGQWLTVVGVAGEIAAEGLLRSGPPRLQAHQPYAEFSSRLPRLGVLLVRATGSDDAVVAQIRAVFRSVAPDVAIREIASVDVQLAMTLAGPRFNAALLSAFAGLALVLAAVGLYSFPARDPLTLATVVGVMLATALVAGLVPARLATRVDPMVALRAE